MRDDQLIQQIETSLTRLKPDDTSSIKQLADLFSQLQIELRDINDATGVAIGKDIYQIIVQQGFTPEQVIELIREAVRSEQLPTEGPSETLVKPRSIPEEQHVFISYVRSDGSMYAERLYQDLNVIGCTAWRDTRDLEGDRDFSAEIERAIEQASHVVVILTSDVKRENNFVRLEIAYALNIGVSVIPLLFEDGHRPIMIINHTYVDFQKPWGEALAELQARLTDPDDRTIVTPVTRRDKEIAYLESVAQQRIFTRWREIYIGMAGEAQVRESPVELTPAAQAFFGMDLEHDIYEEMVHEMYPEAARTAKVEKFDDLREAIRRKQRVALIGNPGAGKTTTLERLADELAARAVEDASETLPLCARLGAYRGGGLDHFLQTAFGRLSLAKYLRQKRVFLLLDGLNEMPPGYRNDIGAWLRRNPDVSVVVSCRTLDYVGLKLPLQRVDVLPLDIDRQYLFIGNFFTSETDREALFLGLAGIKTRKTWEWSKKQNEMHTFKDFWHGDAGKKPAKWELEEHHLWTLRTQLGNYTPDDLPRELYGMLGVTSNPFLLSIAIRLYSTSGEPPKNRGQLFEGFVRMLFKERGKPAAAVRGPWVEEAVQKKGLAALAYRMLTENTGTIVERSWAVQTLARALPEQDAEHLLYLAASASILEDGVHVCFAHQLLQEYFAAFQMGEDMKNGVPTEKYWPGERWWEQTGWEETAVLLAGITRSEDGELDATPVVEWLTPAQPHLAYRCATEGGAPCADPALQALYEAEPPQRIATLAKVRWGNILAERGNPRSGVGVRDGLPDIEWLPVKGGWHHLQAIGLSETQVDLRVRNIHDFRIAKYPVTYVQFQAFVEGPEGWSHPRWWKGLAASENHKSAPGEQSFKFDNHPRDSVSWYDAMAFCAWLSIKLGYEQTLAEWVKEGKTYHTYPGVRLPTEWEWQWAAQGDTGWTYPWGDEYIPGYANIDEVSSGVGPYYLRETTAVGMYPQGVAPCGAMDMIGNVWEWCLNEYGTPYNTRLGGETHRVVRGGSWYLSFRSARAAVRNWGLPLSRLNYRGFRVVVRLPGLPFLYSDL